VGATTYPFQEYYARRWESAESVDSLRQICGRGNPVWVVYTFPRYLRAAAPGVLEVIQQEFTVVRVFPGTLGDGDLVVARYSGRS
jgi:hypothetical protein